MTRERSTYALLSEKGEWEPTPCNLKGRVGAIPSRSAVLRRACCSASARASPNPRSSEFVRSKLIHEATTGGVNQDDAPAHHWTARVALWRPHRQAGIDPQRQTVCLLPKSAVVRGGAKRNARERVFTRVLAAAPGAAVDFASRRTTRGWTAIFWNRTGPNLLLI